MTSRLASSVCSNRIKLRSNGVGVIVVFAIKFPGMDINLGVAGLQSLENFIRLASCADDEATILRALNDKFRHSRAVTQEFVRNGLKEFMYS